MSIISLHNRRETRAPFSRNDGETQVHWMMTCDYDNDHFDRNKCGHGQWS